jgi:hypothetical protein
MINRVVCSRMNRGQPLRGWLTVPKQRSTTCPILQRSASELFSLRKNSHRFMYLCDSSINSRKGLSEGLKCKTVSPQGASRVPGIDLNAMNRTHTHYSTFLSALCDTCQSSKCSFIGPSYFFILFHYPRSSQQQVNLALHSNRIK